MKDEEIIRVASQEILHPSFALTKQYLEVNRISIDNGLPSAARVDRDDENEGTISVYYPVEGEDYYFAVYLDTDPELTVRWVGTTPGIRVYLVVVSENLELETIVKLVGIEPTQKWKKGELRKNGVPLEHNGFTFEPNPEKADELDDKIEKLLGKIVISEENLQVLKAHAEMQINIAYYGYKDEMWGWHIDSGTMQKFANLNLSVDLDLYAGGPDLPE